MTPVRGLRSLLVAQDRGFDLIGPVLGAGTFQMWRPVTCGGIRPGKRAGEPLIYQDYEGALRDAWETVVGRLEVEAANAGAHGVLGVTVSQTLLPGSANGMLWLQLQLLGTAVRVAGVEPLARPFLCNLSTESFLTLLVGGWVPCGLAWGVAAVHVHGYDASPVMQGATWSNAELTVPSAAVALAKRRLDDQARATLAGSGATGAVEVRLELQQRSQLCGAGNGVLIDGLVLGTGVTRYRAALARPSPARNLRTERSVTR